MKFVAIDFETANYSDVSICAAGLAVFQDDQLTDSRHWLIKPPKGHGWFRDDFITIHGITHEHVREAPEFPVIATDLLAQLTTADLVIAHNASFDLRKLHGTLHHYGIACPPFRHACTLALSRQAWPDLPSHALNALAAHIGHTFHHHNAQSDAEAAGRVLLAMINQGLKIP
ncbi:MAG: 3'-5' exonuclease [Phycisphaerales bacterium]|nr:3'-5' exonuclease [Phycisphaerales bacterium]